MNRSATLIIGITLAVLVIGLLLFTDVERVIDWEESFDERSNTPYGISVLYKEMPRLFKNDSIKTVYHTPYSYLSANSEYGYGDHIAEGTYIIIGKSSYLKPDSIEELLRFVSDGNTLFISDYFFPIALMDSLEIDIDYTINKDSLSYLSFQKSKDKKFEVDRNEGQYYFSNITENHRVLGNVEKKDSLIQRPNYIEIPYDYGTILLHLEPKIFTNYNLLKDANYQYVETALSYIPDSNLYFDSATKYYNSYYGEAEKKSDLGWFLEQRGFKWAWYLALLFLLIFIIFTAKRKQRILEIKEPLKNTTLEFVKTISNLYYETKDHKNLVEKKITYFLEKVRTDYFIDTSTLNDEFIAKLALKSGKDKKVVSKLIKLIIRYRSKTEFFEDNLKELNKYIEDFYQH